MPKIVKSGYIVATIHGAHRGLPYDTAKFWVLAEK